MADEQKDMASRSQPCADANALAACIREIIEETEGFDEPQRSALVADGVLWHLGANDLVLTPVAALRAAVNVGDYVAVCVGPDGLALDPEEAKGVLVGLEALKGLTP